MLSLLPWFFFSSLVRYRSSRTPSVSSCFCAFSLMLLSSLRAALRFRFLFALRTPSEWRVLLGSPQQPPMAPGTSNEVVTSKYTVYNFVLKNLWEQFHKVSNIYFIVICFLQMVPQVRNAQQTTQQAPKRKKAFLCLVSSSGSGADYVFSLALVGLSLRPAGKSAKGWRP